MSKICKSSIQESNREKMNNLDTLNPLYTFGNFITGENNKQAYETCVAVAEHPGRNEYNPLYLYGKTGLGKTHLIQAIAHLIIDNNPKKTVVYITAEMFISQMIDAIKNNKEHEFKSEFKKFDLLMIDDIQDIVGKQGT